MAVSTGGTDKSECKLDEFLTSVTGGLAVCGDETAAKKEVWKNLDFWCLDNSIRETTVAQVAGHTLANKQAIYQQCKKCGFTDMVVASFNSMTRVDDDFVKWLQETESKEDFEKFHSFSEVTVGVEYNDNDESTYRFNCGDNEDDLPAGMKKNKLYGLVNTFFEMDFSSEDVKWGDTWNVDDMCKLLDKRIRWCKDNISKSGKNLLNMRDFPTVMNEHPDRMLSIIKFLSQMPEEYRLFGMAFEDPMGEYLPSQLGAWTKAVRDTMTQYGWKDGKLLNHIHGKWGYKDAATMECLANGSDGMWAGCCEEGAAVGHSSTTVAILNLIRHGNELVTQKYNCTQLRKSAIEVTKLTTEAMPHPKQVIYGERATDLVFGFLGIGDFDVAEFFGFEPENRITTMATSDMIIDRLEILFGEDEQFNDEIAEKMRLQMQEDLRSGNKNEYHSAFGLAMLFDRSGGNLTNEMKQVLSNVESNNGFHNMIKEQIKSEWDSFASTKGDGAKSIAVAKKRKNKNKKNKNKDNSKDDEDTNDILSFDKFYHGFMQPYFGCYRCQVTKKALAAMDMNDDLTVDWNEFCVYIDWALREYNDMIKDASQTVQLAFEKGIIPAMRDDVNTIKFFDKEMQVIEPSNYGDHTATVIFLHGIGEFDEFGRDGDYWFGKFTTQDVAKKYPHIRFVFPTANKRGISDKNGGNYNAWFDVNNKQTNICSNNNEKDDENIRLQLGLTSLKTTETTTETTESKEDANNSDDKKKKKKKAGKKRTDESGLLESLRKIKKVIRKEIKKYKIGSNRVMVCGYNQGALMALKAGLKIHKDLASIVCVGGFLNGETKEEFKKCIGTGEKKLKRKGDMPIYWYDCEYVKMYQFNPDGFSKKCFDYIKDDCKLNATYDTYDIKDLEKNDFAKILECVDKHLPEKFEAEKGGKGKGKGKGKKGKKSKE